MWEYECQRKYECEWEGECLGECSLTTLGWLALQVYTHTDTNKYIHYVHTCMQIHVDTAGTHMCVCVCWGFLCTVPVKIIAVLDKASLHIPWRVQFHSLTFATVLFNYMYVCMYDRYN